MNGSTNDFGAAFFDVVTASLLLLTDWLDIEEWGIADSIVMALSLCGRKKMGRSESNGGSVASVPKSYASDE
jgi:hypothetical protein